MKAYKCRGSVLKVRSTAPEIFFEVPHFWVVPLLMGGHVSSLLSAYGRYTLLSHGPDVDSEKTWHCVEDVIVCRVVNTTSQKYW
jgi:hypothetical protein